MKTRLQKYIAESGFCSRRKAEGFILDGQVEVNGEIAQIGMSVEEEDKVTVCGKTIKNVKDKIYIKLNKPVGYTCTNRVFKGEKNIFDLIKTKKRLFCIGRLDKDSRGLVLLTNDGALTQKLTHPKYQHKKVYVVKVFENSKNELAKSIIDNVEKQCKAGIAGEDGMMRAKEIKYMGSGSFKVILTEGKKRQIRRMFGALDMRVKDLKRVGIDNMKIEDVEEGDWKYLSKEEIMTLKK